MRFFAGSLLLILFFSVTGKMQVRPDQAQAEILSGSERIVRNAPFSADAVSENVQFFADGNKITRSVTSRLYRDSQGRFRRDDVPKPIAVGSFVEIPPMILILDPILRLKFYLDPVAKTVRQSNLIESKEAADADMKIEERLDAISKNYALFSRELEEIKSQLRDARKQESEIEKLLSRLEAEKAELTKKIGEIKAQIERLEDSLESLGDRGSKSNSQNQSLRDEQADLVKRVEEAKRLLAQAKAELKDNETKVRQANNRRGELERQEEELDDRDAILESELDELSREKQDLEEKQAKNTKKAQNAIPASEWKLGNPGWEKPAPDKDTNSTDSKSAGSISNSSDSNSSSGSNGRPPRETRLSKTENRSVTANAVNPAVPKVIGGEVRTESLGRRLIEGVEADGTRQTTTVAAGAIGNDRAFEIVYERWFSAELQVVVFSRYSDPRFGEQTYRLTNIKRDEPAREVFTVTADYKVINKLPNSGNKNPRL